MPPQDLEFNEAETHADTTGEDEAPDTQNDETSEAKNTSSETKRRGRPKLPEDLPRERVVVDIPESEKTCSCCQSMLCRMGQCTSEKLVYIPARLYVEVTERPKYVCRQCDTLGEKSVIAMAPPPASIIPKSIATPSLLAQLSRTNTTMPCLSIVKNRCSDNMG
ncbi:IS66 family transposase zinc-finger binding domain-containing protein [Vibrio splendidus]